jgi:hypothetical protein
MSHRKSGERRDDTARDAPSRNTTAIGATCGGLLFATLGVVLRLDHGADWSTEYVIKYHLLPAAVGIVVGAAIGWALAIARAGQGPSRAKRIVGWGLLGGWVAILVPTAFILTWAWIKGDVGDLTFAGVGHHRPPPRSLEAASQAVAVAFVFVILLGVPLFTIGSIIGAVIGAKKARGRANRELPGDLGRTNGKNLNEA